jgi:hypothetical protein
MRSGLFDGSRRHYFFQGIGAGCDRGGVSVPRVRLSESQVSEARPGAPGHRIFLPNDLALAYASYTETAQSLLVSAVKQQRVRKKGRVDCGCFLQMKLFKYVVSASFLGLVIGLLSIYFTLRDRKTHLTMDIAAESNVLDVLHPIPELSILFQGQDIGKENSNLKVLTVRVVNDGESNIHEDDFDSHMPFGLQVDGGTVVRAQVAGSNSPYLAGNLHPQLQTPNRVLFDKIIFDRRKFVAVELLVLHSKDQQPRVRAFGKIAGIEEISVTNSFQDHAQQGFWEQVFQGQPVVQITRAITYGLATLVACIGIGFGIGGILSLVSRWRKSRRRRLAVLVPSPEDPAQRVIQGAIEKVFIEDGESRLRELLVVLERQKLDRSRPIPSVRGRIQVRAHSEMVERREAFFLYQFGALSDANLMHLGNEGHWVIEGRVEAPARRYLEQILALK